MSDSDWEWYFVISKYRNINDGFVYNIDINIDYFSVNSIKKEHEDFMQWFQIKKSKFINNKMVTMVCLSCKSLKDDCLGI